ncbi:MAG: arsenate reductase [Chloroflexi bacterium]|nr:arsenate reductase [Chloroflexota bacterium]
MEAQIFGTKSCKETLKALRFFKERRIKTHFVDLEARAAAAGELRKFGQKFGWGALIDLKSKRFADRHFHPNSFDESQILPLLEADPLLLVTPLVRSGNQIAVGWDEQLWRTLLRAAG